MCPICTIGAAAGVGLSRWLKIDDVISGIWIGALILALGIWTWRWLYKRRAKKSVVILGILIILWWLLTFVPFYYTGVLDNTCKAIWDMNRLVFGSIIGVIAGAIGILVEKSVRSKKGGKAAFHFQKVVLPMSILIITSLIMAALCY